jgi:hypothetical protein
MQIATRIQGVTGGGSLDWRAVTAPVPANWSHIDYGNGRWVAIGNGAPSGYSGLAATSTDNGETWTYTSLPIPSFPVLCFKFFSKVGLFIGMGASVFWTTADGPIARPARSTGCHGRLSVGFLVSLGQAARRSPVGRLSQCRRGLAISISARQTEFHGAF